MENYTPTAAQLHGFSLDAAECYGKPHLGAQYTGPKVTTYARNGWLCAVCMREAINTHHQPDRHVFALMADNGKVWQLRPALFALCGSGTFGCHGAIEHNRLKVRWQWDSPEYGAAWWSGELLEQWGPHHPALYGYGGWVFTEEDGHMFERRGDWGRQWNR